MSRLGRYEFSFLFVVFRSRFIAILTKRMLYKIRLSTNVSDPQPSGAVYNYFFFHFLLIIFVVVICTVSL